MIALALIPLVIALITLVVVLRRHAALPVGDLAREVGHLRQFMADHPTAPFAWRYFLRGAGGPDVGDHAKDKLVVRVDRGPRGLQFRVAPVNAAGNRSGRSRRILAR